MGYELKTKPNSGSVGDFLKKVSDPGMRKDCQSLQKIFRELTGKRAKMWGNSIVGYGRYRYKNRSGFEGDWMLTGFSPRQKSLSIYIMSGFSQMKPLMKKLGKHKTGVSCLYINSLDDIDLKVLKQIIKKSISYMRKTYPTDIK